MTIRRHRKPKPVRRPPAPRHPDERPVDHRFNLSLRGY